MIVGNGENLGFKDTLKQLSESKLCKKRSHKKASFTTMVKMETLVS